MKSLLCKLLPALAVLGGMAASRAPAQTLSLTGGPPYPLYHYWHPVPVTGIYSQSALVDATMLGYGDFPGQFNLTGVNAITVTWSAPPGQMFVVTPPPAALGSLQLSFGVSYAGNATGVYLTAASAAFGLVYGTAPAASGSFDTGGTGTGLNFGAIAMINPGDSSFAFTNITLTISPLPGSSTADFYLANSSLEYQYFAILYGGSTGDTNDPGPLLTIQPLPSNTPSYSVDWFKVAGGGGTSTGGVYTVTGTFGQQDAGGSINGGGYSVTLGFWSLLGQASPALVPSVPVITSQPPSQFVKVGNPAAFNVSVSGTPPLFYQWQKNGANITDDGNISGSTNATLILSATSTNDVGGYSVVIKNAYGNITNSSSAKLTLLLPPPQAAPTLITFDDLPNTESGIAVPGGYGGLSGWANVYELNGVNSGTTYFPNNGMQAGVLSPNNVAIDVAGGGSVVSEISNGTPFNFLSAYLTAAWNDNLQVAFEASGPGVSYNNTYSLSATSPTLVNFNYFGVTQVSFYSYGGSAHPGYGLYGGSPGYYGTQFVMDNVSISTNFPAEKFPPQFQTAALSGGHIQFSWNPVYTYPAVGYQVQYATNLLAPNWINLGGVLTGAGPTISASDTPSADRQRFYRVLLVQ